MQPGGKSTRTSPSGPGAGEEARPARAPLAVLPAALLSASGFVLFALENRPAGFTLLAAALVVAAFLSRRLLVDLALIAVGLTAMSLVPITTDISTGHMAVMGTAMVLAVGIPYTVSRFITREHAIRFPIRTGRPV